jgi:hypothetical protein
MSLEEREGTLDRVSDNGILLNGERLSYSKWFDGERPTVEALGCTVRVVVDVGLKCSFIKRILRIGDKTPGWKPPESSKGGAWGGQGRRMSPEELDLKREDGTRIARSVAIDRAITMAEKGITMERIVDLASAVETYLLKGILPQAAQASLPEVPGKKGSEAPASGKPTKAAQAPTPVAEPPKKDVVPLAKAKPKRLTPQAVNALFNEAMRGGLVKDWQGYVAYVQSVLKVEGKTPYQMSLQDYAVVEGQVRSRLSRGSAA